MSKNYHRFTKADWLKILTEEEYRIMREKGTEPAFCGLYTDNKKAGRYLCKACKTPLFSSQSKYDSGSGWPSFTSSLDEQIIMLEIDNSHGMIRTEVSCATCESHLGHLFDDGPPPTGFRFCLSSIALLFEEAT